MNRYIGKIIKRNTMKMFRLLPVLLLFITITGCDTISSKLNMNKPEVTSVSPGHFSQNVPVDTTISINFNKRMDTAVVNEGFSLSSDSTGTIKGVYSWSNNDQTLTFTPKEHLTGTDKYSIIVSSEVEDTDGNDIGEEFTSSFYINQDSEKPENLSLYLSYTDPLSTITTYDLSLSTIGINPESNIHIEFSEPVDVDSLFDGVVISPSVEGLFSWNTDKTIITFDPKIDLSFGTTYSVTINENIKDSNGNTLEESKNYNFTIGDDFTAPEITAIYQADTSGTALTGNWVENIINNGNEKDGIITIEFTENVSLKTIKDSISFSPSVSFYVTGNNEDSTMKVHFENPVEPETEYRMTLSTSITDSQDNNLNREYIYRFLTNGTNSVRPEVLRIEDPNKAPVAPDPVYIWSNINAVEPMELPGPPIAIDEYPDIKIVFSNPMNRSSVEVDIAYILGSTSSSPYIFKSPSSWNGSATEMTVDLKGLAPGNTYKITIKDSSKDSNGNSLEEDYEQLVAIPLSP